MTRFFSLAFLLAVVTLPMRFDCSGDDDTPTPMPNSCHSDKDCGDSGMYCQNPGEPNSCGNCWMPDNVCDTSDQCSTGQVCAPVTGTCLCEQGVKACQDPCSVTGCPDGQACGDNGQCAIIHCSTGQISCPELTSCQKDAPGDGCVRQTCDSDSSCGEGNYCVEGQCFDTLGFCTYPVP